MLSAVVCTAAGPQGQLYTSATSLCIIQLSCGKHNSVMQFKSYTNARRKGKQPACFRCSPTASRPSQLEQGGYNVIAREYRGEVWAEVCVVPGWSAAVDAYIPEFDLIIQFDGQQHFDKSMHSASAAQQQARDARFNSLCWVQQRKLLRVHHADVHCFDFALRRALTECKQYSTFGFVMYTARWPATSTFARKCESICRHRVM